MAILERFNHLFKKGSSSELSKLVQSGTIRFLNDVKDRDDALKQLVESLVAAKTIATGTQFLQAVLDREGLVSTGISLGAAIPHAKMPEFKDFFIAVGVSNQGIEWDAIDGMPVRLIFMIGGPANKQTEYLQILSRLTAVIKSDDVREKLLEAKKGDEVLGILKKF